MPKKLTQEQIEGWEQQIEAALESQKTRSPEMARDMQKFIEEIETAMEAAGTPLPKHSHRFAPENLWPERKEERQAQTEVKHESPSAAFPPVLKQIEKELDVKYVKAPPYKDAVATVDRHEPRVIEINDPSRFSQGPMQSRGHEIVHLWRNNLPGPLQNAALPDDPEHPYDISHAPDLRKKGYNLATIPQEMAATIVQTYIADPSKRKELQPWIDDMGVIAMSVMKMTEPDAPTIDRSVRPPAPPVEIDAKTNKK